MSISSRLRCAPSPTGMLHVGNARTFLFNWLYAKRHNGSLLLRIEDTDAERDREEWIGAIIDGMKWLGITYDEGPVRQSVNRADHSAAGQKLYDQGNAYYCDCTRETVDERTKDNATPGYDNFCRDRNLEPGAGRALRFRIPSGTTMVKDLIRGDVTFENSTIEDFVIVRSTGVPMYVLANAVDDMNDRITHVVRGEEHLPNTPKQRLLWDALEAGDPPAYVHLPVIVNESRKKLSKRRDKVALELYRDEGYLPEAMRNYLALLGWAPKGDREIVSLETLINEFDFADVQKSSAFFDIKKLDHFNGEYIRALNVEDFVERCAPFIDVACETLWERRNYDPSVFKSIAPLVQERVAKLNEVGPMIDFLFLEEVAFDESAKKVINDPRSLLILDAVLNEYPKVDWTTSSLHDATLKVGESEGMKLGKAQAPIRLAITGKRVGPPLFESLELLGKEKTMSRLRKLREVCARGVE